MVAPANRCSRVGVFVSLSQPKARDITVSDKSIQIGVCQVNTRFRSKYSPPSKNPRFTHLPQKCKISIFTVNGDLVQTLEHDSPTGDGDLRWNLRSKDNFR